MVRPSFQTRIWYSYKLVMWPLSALDDISHPVQHHNPEHRQSDPDHKELWAYLPKNIEAHGGVVPNAKPKPNIQDKAGHKLHRSDAAGAHNGLSQQRHTPRKLSTKPLHWYRQKHSQGEHRPAYSLRPAVGGLPGHFNKEVDRPDPHPQQHAQEPLACLTVRHCRSPSHSYALQWHP